MRYVAFTAKLQPVVLVGILSNVNCEIVIRSTRSTVPRIEGVLLGALLGKSGFSGRELFPGGFGKPTV